MKSLSTSIKYHIAPHAFLELILPVSDGEADNKLWVALHHQILFFI